MFGLQAHADEACCEVFEARNAGEDTERERKLYWGRIVQDPVENTVRKYLKALGVAYGAFPMLLNLLQMMRGERLCAKGFGKDVRCGDGVLKGNVDADASHGRHGVRGVADAQQPG